VFSQPSLASSYVLRDQRSDDRWDGDGTWHTVGLLTLDVDDVKRLKKKHFPNRDPRDVELHAIDILNHKKAFKSMTVPVRLEILTDVIDLITGIDCTIISVLIKKDLIQNKKLDPNMIAIEFLFERICYFLDVKNRDNVENGRFEEYGLMLFDSVNDKYDNKIRAKLRLLFESGTKFEKNNYLIEDPLFVNSEYRHLSQLADCVAYF